MTAPLSPNEISFSQLCKPQTMHRLGSREERGIEISMRTAKAEREGLIPAALNSIQIKFTVCVMVLFRENMKTCSGGLVTRNGLCLDKDMSDEDFSAANGLHEMYTSMRD